MMSRKMKDKNAIYRSLGEEVQPKRLEETFSLKLYGNGNWVLSYLSVLL